MSIGSRGLFTYQEIMSQGQVWKATLEAFKDQAERLSSWLELPHRDVLFTGCGSTYYLSLSAASIWQSLVGQSARALPASEIWLYPAMMSAGKGSLLAAISRSAETTETIYASRAYRKLTGQEYLCVSCYGDRGLALETLHHLVAEQAREQSVAQTRAFSSMLLLIQALAGHVARRNDILSALEVLPTVFPDLVKESEPIARKLAAEMQLSHFVFLGSGFNYGLACEAMLKMKEMSLSVSEPFHFLEYRHGPKSMVTNGTLVIGLISEPAKEQEAKVLTEMKALGATTLALCEDSRGVEADYVIEFQSGTPAEVSCLLTLPPLQMFAFYRSMEKGLNPDLPNNLDAVVKL